MTTYTVIYSDGIAIESTTVEADSIRKAVQSAALQAEADALVEFVVFGKFENLLEGLSLDDCPRWFSDYYDE